MTKYEIIKQEIKEQIKDNILKPNKNAPKPDKSMTNALIYISILQTPKHLYFTKILHKNQVIPFRIKRKKIPALAVRCLEFLRTCS